MVFQSSEFDLAQGDLAIEFVEPAVPFGDGCAKGD